jgi:hypothetical protein
MGELLRCLVNMCLSFFFFADFARDIHSSCSRNQSVIVAAESLGVENLVAGLGFTQWVTFEMKSASNA